MKTWIGNIKKQLKACSFDHVSSTSLVAVKGEHAVIIEPTGGNVEQAEDGTAVMTQVQLQVYVLKQLKKIDDGTFDETLDALDVKVNEVRTVLQQQHAGVKYSNELIDAVKIGALDYMLWQFDATLIFN